MKKTLFIITMLSLFFIIFHLSSSAFRGPKGACVYGPPGMKVCIDGVYEDECKNNFKGVWYPGKRCP